MPIPNKPGYTHGSTGTQPPVAIDWESGDPVDEAYFDYFIDTQFDYIKALIDALNDLDSDDDGKVDSADFADNATNATSTFKGNDIVDSNGVAFNTERVEGLDGNFHRAGSLPEFSGTSTAISNTSEGDIFYITGDNSVYFNNGGSAINLTKKYIDILVNGGQQASYSQYDTNGDYDVSVSPNTNTVDATQSFNSFFGDVAGSDLEPLPSVSLPAEYDKNLYGSVTFATWFTDLEPNNHPGTEIEVNGNVVAGPTDLETDDILQWSGQLSTNSISGEIRTSQSFDTGFEQIYITTQIVGTTHRDITLNVDGVSQTTSN